MPQRSPRRIAIHITKYSCTQYSNHVCISYRFVGTRKPPPRTWSISTDTGRVGGSCVDTGMATPSRAMYSTGRSHAADIHNIQHAVTGVRVVRIMPACGCNFIRHKGWGLGSTERKLAEDLKIESSKLAETLNHNKQVLHSRTDARHNLPPACGGGGSVADGLLRQRALDSKPEQHNTHTYTATCIYIPSHLKAGISLRN